MKKLLTVGLVTVLAAGIVLGVVAGWLWKHSPSPPSSAQKKAKIALKLNHCAVEDIVFDGRTWSLRLGQQFGSGDVYPRNWQGSGTIAKTSSGELRYVDAGGKVLTFILRTEHRDPDAPYRLCA